MNFITFFAWLSSLIGIIKDAFEFKDNTQKKISLLFSAIVFILTSIPLFYVLVDFVNHPFQELERLIIVTLDVFKNVDVLNNYLTYKQDYILLMRKMITNIYSLDERWEDLNRERNFYESRIHCGNFGNITKVYKENALFIKDSIPKLLKNNLLFCLTFRHETLSTNVNETLNYDNCNIKRDLVTSDFCYKSISNLIDCYSNENNINQTEDGYTPLRLSKFPEYIGVKNKFRNPKFFYLDGDCIMYMCYEASNKKCTMNKIVKHNFYVIYPNEEYGPIFFKPDKFDDKFEHFRTLIDGTFFDYSNNNLYNSDVYKYNHKKLAHTLSSFDMMNLMFDNNVLINEYELSQMKDIMLNKDYFYFESSIKIYEINVGNGEFVKKINPVRNKEEIIVGFNLKLYDDIFQKDIVFFIKKICVSCGIL